MAMMAMTTSSSIRVKPEFFPGPEAASCGRRLGSEVEGSQESGAYGLSARRGGIFAFGVTRPEALDSSPSLWLKPLPPDGASSLDSMEPLLRIRWGLMRHFMVGSSVR